jgi:hypothetical protein
MKEMGLMMATCASCLKEIQSKARTWASMAIGFIYKMIITEAALTMKVALGVHLKREVARLLTQLCSNRTIPILTIINCWRVTLKEKTHQIFFRNILHKTSQWSLNKFYRIHQPRQSQKLKAMENHRYRYLNSSSIRRSITISERWWW